MNTPPFESFNKQDRIRIIRTLQYSGLPLPINLIVSHLTHPDQIFVISPHEFDFSFKGHSDYIKQLWQEHINQPVLVEDSSSDCESSSTLQVTISHTQPRVVRQNRK
jgi:hypothetical protein